MSLKIDLAFLQKFIDDAYGLPIAHENLNYSPVSGTAYAELHTLPNDITPLSLKHSDQTDGVFRVILRYPANTGAINIKTMADSILSGFKIGTIVSYDGQKATVFKTNRNNGIHDNQWHTMIVDIFYRAFITR